MQIHASPFNLPDDVIYILMLKQLIFLILTVNSLAYQKRDVDYAPVNQEDLWKIKMVIPRCI